MEILLKPVLNKHIQMTSSVTTMPYKVVQEIFVTESNNTAVVASSLEVQLL